MTYRPLEAPLIDGYAPPSAQACVVIPARNEEHNLPRALDALRLQNDVNGARLESTSYEVVLLLNNCTDSSGFVAEEYKRMHETFALHIANRNLCREEAHVGTARRLLMDTAYHRLQRTRHKVSAILSTDADTVVAPDWIARNLAALEAGADAVGGVIHLFPEDSCALEEHDYGTYLAYERDRQLQKLVAQLESSLDPDPADPMPRHLHHFGASLACTTTIYAIAGGLPPVNGLEDIAFVDALRKVSGRIRHCPYTWAMTSARLDGRAEVGLSGQLTSWQQQYRENKPHLVDSAEWMEHRFRSLCALRRINESVALPSLIDYPETWRTRIAALHADRLTNATFLELLDCDALIEESFAVTEQPRRSDILSVIASVTAMISHLEG